MHPVIESSDSLKRKPDDENTEMKTNKKKKKKKKMGEQQQLSFHFSTDNKPQQQPPTDIGLLRKKLQEVLDENNKIKSENKLYKNRISNMEGELKKLYASVRE